MFRAPPRASGYFRTHLYYRVYHWDGSKIARVQDWKVYDVK